VFCLRILKNMISSQKIKTQFFFQKKVTLNDRKRLKAFVSDIFVKTGGKTEGELRVIFCSDEELLQINRNFLKHDYYTDIITFPFTKPDDIHIDAELYISIDRVKENAVSFESSFTHGLHRVIFHGVLHLCGLNDKTRNEIQAMRESEDKLLKQYFNVSRETFSP